MYIFLYINHKKEYMHHYVFEISLIIIIIEKYSQQGTRDTKNNNLIL